MNELFIKRLKELRKEKNVTQDFIADLLHIRRQTYSEYERGNITPPMNKIIIMSEFFNVPIAYLSGVSDSNNEFELSKQFQVIIEILNTNTMVLKFDGIVMDEEARKLIIRSMDNMMKMCSIMVKQQ